MLLNSSSADAKKQGNCGSITPAVLRAFVARIPRVRALTLGLSYSLTDENVFACVADLPALTVLKMRYYMVRPAHPSPLLWRKYHH